MAKKKIKCNGFKWIVWLWDFNHDALEEYDVVPMFLRELDNLKPSEIPTTEEAFSTFLDREAKYHFWSKCEYEMIVHSWPMLKNDTKVDVYQQLKLNWDAFVHAFWSHIG